MGFMVHDTGPDEGSSMRAGVWAHLDDDVDINDSLGPLLGSNGIVLQRLLLLVQETLKQGRDSRHLQQHSEATDHSQLSKYNAQSFLGWTKGH